MSFGEIKAKKINFIIVSFDFLEQFTIENKTLSSKCKQKSHRLELQGSYETKKSQSQLITIQSTTGLFFAFLLLLLK